MSLRDVVDEHNMFAKLFREEPISLRHLTQTEATKLFHRIDSDLSPEHLHMDGEATPAQAQKSYRRLTQAVAELKALGFVPPEDIYNF